MTPYEIIGSPLSLWLAPLGTVFPLIDVAPAVAWKLIGTNGTANQDDSGVVVTHSQKVEVARPAGRTGPGQGVDVRRGLHDQIGLWDCRSSSTSMRSPASLRRRWPRASARPATRRRGLSRGVEVTQYALLARGVSPYGDR
jgi:hypothetical protein